MEATLVLVAILLATIIIICAIFAIWAINRQKVPQTDIIGQLQSELDRNSKSNSTAASDLRKEITTTLKSFGDSQSTELKNFRQEQTDNLNKVRQEQAESLDKVRQENEKQLTAMREMVENKLQNTLENRLGKSFKLVNEQLESVHKGLGEMQNLATNVGDLSRIFTNANTKGTWGEYQLGDILSNILSAEQFAAQVEIVSSSGKSRKVDYAVRLPGEDKKDPVWLPIDSKFPLSSYQSLVDARERAADTEEIKGAKNKFLSAVEKQAKDIADKYISPPHSTPFAIMFLPAESLYAEVVRTAGIMDKIQTNYKVILTGPNTLSALLNSLRVGFSTLAIQKRSHEVWRVLGAVKTEFGNYSAFLDDVHRNLQTASNTMDKAERRTRAINRKLREVEQLSEVEAKKILPENEVGYLPENEVGHTEV